MHDLHAADVQVRSDDVSIRATNKHVAVRTTVRVALGMAAGHSWDDADFELSPLPAADEEAFIHAPMTQEDEG